MPDIIQFTLPGPPVPWQRCRLGRAGRHYTPAVCRDYAATVRWVFAQAAPGWQPARGPVALTLTAYLRPPKSWPKWRREMLELGQADAVAYGAIACCKKPDLSNILKLVEDALNGVAYHDDAQIAAEQMGKYWGDDERVEVTLTFWDVPTRGNDG